MKAETRQKLFNYMSNEHGLHLLENELDEIERILGDKREYAKDACKRQREICSKIHKEKLNEYWHILSSDELQDEIDNIINSPTPDFE